MAKNGLLLIFIFLFSLNAFSQNKCVEVFQKNFLTLENAEEVTVYNNEFTNHDGSYTGYVLVSTRTSLVSAKYENAGILHYTVRGNRLTIERYLGNEKYNGQNIYRSQVERVLLIHPEIAFVVTSISGSYYEQYKEIFRQTLNSREALEENIVSEQYTQLGFSEILSVTEVNNGMQSFLRVVYGKNPKNQ